MNNWCYPVVAFPLLGYVTWLPQDFSRWMHGMEWIGTGKKWMNEWKFISLKWKDTFMNEKKVVGEYTKEWYKGSVSLG